MIVKARRERLRDKRQELWDVFVAITFTTFTLLVYVSLVFLVQGRSFHLKDRSDNRRVRIVEAYYSCNFFPVFDLWKDFKTANCE